MLRTSDAVTLGQPGLEYNLIVRLRTSHNLREKSGDCAIDPREGPRGASRCRAHLRGLRLIGLRPGDVISHLNNQAIGSAKEFTEIAKELPKNRSVSMRVLRQGRASFITFKLAE